MEGSAYEIAVYVLRYWFAALMVFLLFRLVRSVVRGWNEQRTRERAASSKYTVGLLEVVAPELDARGKVSPLYGRRYALRRENRIGSARKADWRLSAPGVAPLHASIYQKGDRILRSDGGTKAGVLLNGRRIPEDVALFDGDVIGLGPVRLLLHLAGSGEGKRSPEDLYYAPPYSYELPDEEQEEYEEAYEEDCEEAYGEGDEEECGEDGDWEDEDEDYGSEDEDAAEDDEDRAPYENYGDRDADEDRDEDDGGYLQRRLGKRPCGRAAGADFAQSLYEDDPPERRR